MGQEQIFRTEGPIPVNQISAWPGLAASAIPRPESASRKPFNYFKVAGATVKKKKKRLEGAQIVPKICRDNSLTSVKSFNSLLRPFSGDAGQVLDTGQHAVLHEGGRAIDRGALRGHGGAVFPPVCRPVPFLSALFPTCVPVSASL